MSYCGNPETQLSISGAAAAAAAGEVTVTRFSVISPSGDWLARDCRKLMDSRKEHASCTCCSAHGSVI